MNPIAASSQSKSKLGAFRFDEGENRSLKDTQYCGVLESEKENGTTVDDQEPNSLSQRTPQFSQKSAVRELRECPQTPVGRLPLAELIASGEDLNLHLQNLTPHERVLWYHHSHQKEGQASSQGANICRKRRYSSSPASASQNETFNLFSPGNPSFDLQKLQKVLKTPQADPASDLWSLYSSKPNPYTDKPSPIGLAGPSFALHSSPQTPAQPLSLRRSISCGTEWPTSAAKRRKIRHRTGHQEARIGLAGHDIEDDQKDMSKMERVSLLVDEIQLRLARPDMSEDEEIAGPPSSSPFAQKNDISVLRPLQHSQADRGNIPSEPNQPPAASPDIVRHQPSINPINPWAEPITSQGVFSDFDDDDLDLEILQTIDEEARACVSVAGDLLATKPRLKPHDDGIDTCRSPSAAVLLGEVSMNGQKKPTPTSQSPRNATSPGHLNSHSQLPGSDTGSKSDEFDEFDDDYAVDLEHVAAMYDLQPRRQVQGAVNHVQVIKSPRRSQVRSSGTRGIDVKGQSGRCTEDMAEYEAISDDEFGGGLEFENIIAECERASQRDQIASQPQSSVRTKIFGPSI